ncbi:hypothetical protein HKCCE2091_20845 [Rhodobacterales bacterium HKCCE2091]|nr:hypothetical protein [Rhodobacterales bacterium HKCCE2091]
MTGAATFIAEAAALYERVNAANLSWALDRPRLARGFLNTKCNSITLRDYGPEDGIRSPEHVYGWMAGRGLESLATHGAFFAGRDAALATRADAAARETSASLADLRAGDGHVYFSYDAGFAPVYSPDQAVMLPQARPEGIFTYSDAFAAKGLVAAAAGFGRDSLPGHLDYLMQVIEAVATGRFQMTERTELSEENLAAEPADFGPFMILLGAAELLQRFGRADLAESYAPRFIDHVLSRHYDPASDLLRTVEGGDGCNAGHGIEFVGFALAALPVDADPGLVSTLQDILVASVHAAYIDPGICLEVSVSTGQVRNDYCPWWSLPETIRSAALAWERTRSDEVLAVWRLAHEAFFTRYWRQEARIAYQTLTPEGPVDYIPATPDLDPGYHSGLSLLAAIRVAERMTPNGTTGRQDGFG